MANTRSGKSSSSSIKNNRRKTKAGSGSTSGVSGTKAKASSQLEDGGRQARTRRRVVTRKGTARNSNAPEPGAARGVAVASGDTDLVGGSSTGNAAESPSGQGRLRDKRALPGRWSVEKQREAAKNLLDLSAASPSSSFALDLDPSDQSGAVEFDLSNQASAPSPGAGASSSQQAADSAVSTKVRYE